MDKIITCQGRSIGPLELQWLNNIVSEYPDWSRHKITKYICSVWGWCNHNGCLKTFAARSLIDKLEQKGLLKLPPIRQMYKRPQRSLYPKNFIVPPKHPKNGRLDSLTPLTVHIPPNISFEEYRLGYYLKHHHYLSFNRTVGENIKYLIQDRHGQDIAVLVFGSAAWKTAPRDEYIGWSADERKRNITFVVNNSRFLILPWVRIPNLASHILGFITRRIRQDWIDKYSHPIHLLETFVESMRFDGTSYKAANWQLVGKTKGRSRQGKENKQTVPIKDIWLYPLIRNFRRSLY